MSVGPAIVLINPGTTNRFDDSDEQHEGRLGFFDAHGPLGTGLWRGDWVGSPVRARELIHHSVVGWQYASFRLAAHLAREEMAASIGPAGHALDNAPTESNIGLYKTEVIKLYGPWRTPADTETATAERDQWFHQTRLFSGLGHIQPAEHEANCYQ